MFVLLITIIIGIIIVILSGNFFIGLAVWLFLLFLLAGFRFIDVLLSDKEIAGIATLLGLAWLLGYSYWVQMMIWMTAQTMIQMIEMHNQHCIMAEQVNI